MLYQGLLDKNYNTTQIGSDYGTMGTLLDVIKASAHACFCLTFDFGLGHFIQSSHI